MVEIFDRKPATKNKEKILYGQIFCKFFCFVRHYFRENRQTQVFCMEATELLGWDVGCHIGCDLRTEVTPRRIPVFIGVSGSLGCDVGRYCFLINQIWNTDKFNVTII